MVRHIQIALAVLLLSGNSFAAPADQWTTAASAAVANGTLKQFAARIERELEPLLGAPPTKELDQFVHLVALREYGRYFAALDRKKIAPAQLTTLQWLVTKPKLLHTLMLAVTKKDTPDRVLAVLDSLHTDMGDHLEEWPDLVTAICVVWDVPARNFTVGSEAVGRLDLQRPRELLHYYTNMRRQLQLDPQRVPWQLAVYTVDNILSEEEVGWALEHYAQHDSIGSVYFDVRYDRNRYYGSSTPSRSKGQPYTLQNIALLGGVCADQAYFATNVARSVGVPAATATGLNSGSGIGRHAWTGYLSVQGDRAEWNFTQGRYPDYRFFRGRVVDPQTREYLNESGVSLVAEVWNTPPQKRSVSLAIYKVADLIDPPNRPQWYVRAINDSPGNRPVWFALADLGTKKILSTAQINEMKQVVNRFAVKRYPDFAYNVLRRSISGQSNQQQIESLNDMGRMFDETRPDLLADLEAAKGDLLRQDKKPSEALAVYRNALDVYGASSTAVAMDLMVHVEDLLREAKQLGPLAETYQYVWEHQAQPPVSAHTHATPYYMLGERYLAVLQESGDSGGAQNVQARLNSLSAAARSMTGNGG